LIVRELLQAKSQRHAGIPTHTVRTFLQGVPQIRPRECQTSRLKLDLPDSDRNPYWRLSGCRCIRSRWTLHFGTFRFGY